MNKKKILIIGSILLIIAAAVWFFMSFEKKELQVHTATIQEGTIETSVTATGYIQPVDKIDVGTQVSGVIEKIFVDFNSQVKKGQLLAELDKSTLSEKVTQAEASLLSAQSELTYTQQNYDRTKQLYDVKAATKAAYEGAVNQLAQANTGVANAQANLHQAQVNLSYAEIYSPIDGVVLNRAVEEGQTVASSFNTPTLFTIANDLTKMQVEADVDEADIGQVVIGQPVTFTVDAYYNDTFTGTVNQIRLQPTVTSNVVTYTVIVEAPNPDEKLFPGMTASITILTYSEKGLVVPIEATNTKLDPDVMKKLNVQSSNDTLQSAKGVWIKTTEGFIHRNIKTGTSDGVNIIVEEGLQAGDIVLLSASLQNKNNTNEAAAVTNPLMPRRPPRR